MACLVLQPSSPSPCIYSQCLLRFSATRSRTAVLEFVGAINGQPTRILADTVASLSLLSSVFDDKSRVKTKNIKKGSVHGITGHSMSFSQEAVVQIGVNLSPNSAVEDGPIRDWCHACRNPRTLAAIGWVCADR